MITYAMLARQLTLPKPLFDFYPLGFDHLTNAFLRKSRVFTSIQNPWGVTLPRTNATRGPVPVQPTPLPPITYIQPLQFHAITHSFPQRRPTKPFHINVLRTLFIATGVVSLPDGARFRKGVSHMCRGTTQSCASARSSAVASGRHLPAQTAT